MGGMSAPIFTGSFPGLVPKSLGGIVNFLRADGTYANPVAAASAVSLITEVITAGSQANVQFAAIPATYRDLLLRVRARGTNATQNTNINIRFNGDNGANYDYENFQAAGVASAAGGALGATSANLGNISAANSPANVSSIADAIISDYRGTVFQKIVAVKNSWKDGNAVIASLRVEANSCFWRNTAAINQIDIFLGAGNFVDGSIVSLYGMS